MEFMPDYQNVVDAAYNRCSKRLPLYDHNVSTGVMEKILGREFTSLFFGNNSDLDEFMRIYCSFFKTMGYDVVILEQSAAAMFPGSGALSGHKEGAIKDRNDFNAYPWDGVAERFFEEYGRIFNSLRKAMPDGMKALGGVGNGLFECVQDIVGYQNLCYISADDPELFEDLFKKVGGILIDIWTRFAKEYADLYCVMRFGDDLGYKSNTLLQPDVIRKNIIPVYAEIIRQVHGVNRPFLLHSCGQIYDIMDDLINDAKIDAKHSNEDQIALFTEWVDRYGDRIGNFGGVDTDVLCQFSQQNITDYVNCILEKCGNKPGIAIGCGNSIPDYVPVESYMTMTQTVRKWRGE